MNPNPLTPIPWFCDFGTNVFDPDLCGCAHSNVTEFTWLPYEGNVVKSAGSDDDDDGRLRSRRNAANGAKNTTHAVLLKIVQS